MSRLREWRELHGYTIDEVSGLTGLSTSMISLVERGRRKVAPATKVAMARRLGASVRDLFDIDDLESTDEVLAS